MKKLTYLKHLNNINNYYKKGLLNATESKRLASEDSWLSIHIRKELEKGKAVSNTK